MGIDQLQEIKEPFNVFWFRRDLRLTDNCGLFQALKEDLPVLPVFIFDKNILDDLEDPKDARVEFIHKELSSIQAKLIENGKSLLVLHGNPIEIWRELIKNYIVKGVFTNRDYEPYARNRDEEVEKILSAANIPFHTFKDQVIFEKDEVCKDDGDPYVVFTPYSRKWIEKLGADNPGADLQSSKYFRHFPSEDHLENLLSAPELPFPDLNSLGFKQTGIKFPPKKVSPKTIREYKEKRDYPAEDATSRLGVHFRFGTISIREKARKSIGLSKTFLNELIWRDFYSMILWSYPRVVKEPFRKKYQFIEWRNNESEFNKWCEGKTGYPIVDAGMRQLNESGYMHNRVRMITASFLTKHLLIDWRWGEAYFAQKLLDYDLASNNGGWQWAAGCGTDAAPYFRIFNPHTQLDKFDKDRKYTKQWIPEFGTEKYPDFIVDHKEARERCLKVYKMALDRSE